MKLKWLARDLIQGPYLTLCLNQEEFNKELKKLCITEHMSFLNSTHANATSHFLTSPQGNRCAIICIGDTGNHEPIQIACLIVHEAVHIFDEFCESIGEQNPSSEFKAYSIQSISQRLMYEYVRRT